MKRAPGPDALLLVFLVLGCLEIAQTPVYDGLDASGLLAAADAALYEAKEQGRNRVRPAARTTTAAQGAPGEAARP